MLPVANFFFGLAKDGSPLLLADAPQPDGAVRAQTQRAKESAQRQDVTRRRDAVVDAARTLEDLNPAGVEAFVRTRWRGTKVLEQADIDAFATDAAAQRTHDVVDALASRVRRGVLGIGERHVRVDLPRGWVRRALRAMSDDEIAQASQRLVDRGWTDEQVAKALKTYRPEIRRAS